MIKGIGASSGIAIAKAYKLVMPDLTVTQNTVEDVAAEIKKFEDCMAETAKQLKKLLLKTYQLKKLLYLMLMH